MKKKGKKPTKNESSLFGLRICRHWVHAGAEEIPVVIQAQAPCSMKTVDTGRTESQACSTCSLKQWSREQWNRYRCGAIRFQMNEALHQDYRR